MIITTAICGFLYQFEGAGVKDACSEGDGFFFEDDVCTKRITAVTINKLNNPIGHTCGPTTCRILGLNVVYSTTINIIAIGMVKIATRKSKLKYFFMIFTVPLLKTHDFHI